MARARNANLSQSAPDGEIDGDVSPPEALSDEQVTDLGGPPVANLLRGDPPRRLPDPREQTPVKKADATAGNRRGPDAFDVASARVIGGEAFADLERSLARAKSAFLEAADGADLGELRARYQATKREHDEAVLKLSAEARKSAEIKRYRVLGEKGKLAATSGSHGRARLNPGKVVDSLNFDIAALKSQGIRLREIGPDDADDAA